LCAGRRAFASCCAFDGCDFCALPPPRCAAVGDAFAAVSKRLMAAASLES
jgi:hypothetical protein